jgi:20S proteasome alpha/beta subunit
MNTLVCDAFWRLFKWFTAVAYAGLIADSRTLVDRAQLEAQNYWFTYDRKIKVEGTNKLGRLAAGT